MMTLRERLQEKRDWLASTPGIKGAYTHLTVAELDRLLRGLDAVENAVYAPEPDLPKINHSLIGLPELSWLEYEIRKQFSKDLA